MCNLFCLYIFIEVLLEFGDSSYEFDEDIGQAELELVLDGPLDCCSILVRVKVEDITATGKCLANSVCVCIYIYIYIYIYIHTL